MAVSSMPGLLAALGGVFASLTVPARISDKRRSLRIRTSGSCPATLPDGARVRAHHLLRRVALERCGKRREVRQRPVDAEALRRVRIDLHRQAGIFVPALRAPGLREAQEEELIVIEFALRCRDLGILVGAPRQLQPAEV